MVLKKEKKRQQPEDSDQLYPIAFLSGHRPPLTVRVNDKTFQGWNVDLCLVALMVGRLETP